MKNFLIKGKGLPAKNFVLKLPSESKKQAPLVVSPEPVRFWQLSLLITQRC